MKGRRLGIPADGYNQNVYITEVDIVRSRAAWGPEGSHRTSFDFPPNDRERAFNIIAAVQYRPITPASLARWSPGRRQKPRFFARPA
jgi:hypothetical protein